MWVWIWMAVIAVIAIAGLRFRKTTYYLQTATVCFVGMAVNSAYLVFIYLSPAAEASFRGMRFEFVIVFLIIELGFMGMFLRTLWNIHEDRENLLLEISYLDTEKEAVRKEIGRSKFGYKVEDE